MTDDTPLPFDLPSVRRCSRPALLIVQRGGESPKSRQPSPRLWALFGGSRKPACSPAIMATATMAGPTRIACFASSSIRSTLRASRPTILGGRPSRDAILAAISTTIAWGPLMRKRISRLTAETLPWYLRLYGVMIGASIPAKHHQPGSLWGISREERFGRWTMADFLFLALTGKKPTAARRGRCRS
jgi:hypothetical protein